MPISFWRSFAAFVLLAATLVGSVVALNAIAYYVLSTGAYGYLVSVPFVLAGQWVLAGRVTDWLVAPLARETEELLTKTRQLRIESLERLAGLRDH